MVEDERETGKKSDFGVRNWYRYDSEEVVVTRFNVGSVISAVILSKDGDGEVYVACAKKGSDDLKLVVIDYFVDDEDSGTTVCGLHYRKCEIARTVNMKRDAFQNGIRGHCLLVPLVCEGDDYEQEYGIIFDDWDVLCENGEKGISPLCKVLFG